MVLGQQDMLERFVAIRAQVLTQSRDVQKLKADIVAMREKMRTHLDKTTATEFDLKQGRGGITDIEFLSQYLVLQHSQTFATLAEYSDNIRIFCSMPALPE